MLEQGQGRLCTQIKIKANNSDAKEETYRNPQKRVNISRTYDSTLQIGVILRKTGIV